MSIDSMFECWINWNWQTTPSTNDQRETNQTINHIEHRIDNNVWQMWKTHRSNHIIQRDSQRRNECDHMEFNDCKHVCMSVSVCMSVYVCASSVESTTVECTTKKLQIDGMIYASGRANGSLGKTQWERYGIWDSSSTGLQDGDMEVGTWYGACVHVGRNWWHRLAFWKLG